MINRLNKLRLKTLLTLTLYLLQICSYTQMIEQGNRLQPVIPVIGGPNDAKCDW